MKLARVRIAVCGGKLQERGRSSAPHKNLEVFDLSSKEPTLPTGTRNKGPTEIYKKRYKLELKKKTG